MSYIISRKKEIKNGHFIKRIGELRAHPFLIWISGITIGVLMGCLLL